MQPLKLEEGQKEAGEEGEAKQEGDNEGIDGKEQLKEEGTRRNHSSLRSERRRRRRRRWQSRRGRMRGLTGRSN